MFLRLLFLLLIALNVGVAAWLVFGHPPDASVPAADPGVPELKLLPGAAAADANMASAGAAAPAPGDRCMVVGPFATQTDARRQLERVRRHVWQAQLQEQTTDQTAGWWVYLPAFTTRESALAAAKKLAARGVHDDYVVTAGDNSNTVSLGLFHDEENARHRRDRIAALGFKPQVSQRSESMPQYWVKLVLRRRSGFDWHAYVNDPDVRARHMQCAGG